MKKLTLTILLFTGFFLTSYSQETVKEKKQPLEVYQVGSSKIVVWENVNADGTTWKVFKVEKNYQTKEGESKTTSYFNKEELIELKSAIEKAIAEESKND